MALIYDVEGLTDGAGSLSSAAGRQRLLPRGEG